MVKNDLRTVSRGQALSLASRSGRFTNLVDERQKLTLDSTFNDETQFETDSKAGPLTQRTLNVASNDKPKTSPMFVTAKHSITQPFKQFYTTSIKPDTTITTSFKLNSMRGRNEQAKLNSFLNQPSIYSTKRSSMHRDIDLRCRALTTAAMDDPQKTTISLKSNHPYQVSNCLLFQQNFAKQRASNTISHYDQADATFNNVVNQPKASYLTVHTPES